MTSQRGCVPAPPRPPVLVHQALPSPAEMEAVAEAWRPYRSVGSYYMWRVEVPKQKRKQK